MLICTSLGKLTRITEDGGIYKRSVCAATGYVVTRRYHGGYPARRLDRTATMQRPYRPREHGLPEHHGTGGRRKAGDPARRIRNGDKV